MWFICSGWNGASTSPWRPKLRRSAPPSDDDPDNVAERVFRPVQSSGPALSPAWSWTYSFLCILGCHTFWSQVTFSDYHALNLPCIAEQLAVHSQVWKWQHKPLLGCHRSTSKSWIETYHWCGLHYLHGKQKAGCIWLWPRCVLLWMPPQGNGQVCWVSDVQKENIKDFKGILVNNIW